MHEQTNQLLQQAEERLLNNTTPPNKPVLWIVIPCYNEENVLPKTAPLFSAEIDKLANENLISPDSKVLFVNDGSTDSTWSIIKSLHAENPVFEGLSLSRNRGHQNALVAGLMEARRHCDISISIDCDGQDDVGVMEDMVRSYLDGNEIVYGVRDDRSTDSAFKRGSANLFYSLMGKLGAETVKNHADYRLLSKKALDALAEYDEVNLYLRGIIPLIGFSSDTVTYARAERVAGESHYPLRKMFGLGLNGITSLSIKPVRVISALGILFGILGIIGLIWVFVQFFRGQTVSGWSSMISVILLMGGLQLFSLGVIGEYIGKIYLETKRRPRFIIEETTYEE